VNSARGKHGLRVQPDSVLVPPRVVLTSAVLVAVEHTPTWVVVAMIVVTVAMVTVVTRVTVVTVRVVCLSGNRC
jgi:hypothetical protein